MFVRRMRPFGVFALLTLIFGSIAPGVGSFQLGPLQFSEGAFIGASFFSLRLLFIGGVTVWMMLVVGFDRIIRFITRLGKRGKLFGIDFTPILLTTVLAIRFLPVFQEEADRLRLGWKARGAGLMGKGPIGVVRRAAAMMIPLMAASLRRAEALSDMLELRVSGSGHRAAASIGAALEHSDGTYPADKYSEGVVRKDVGEKRVGGKHDARQRVRLRERCVFKLVFASVIAWIPVVLNIGKIVGVWFGHAT